MTWLRSFLLVGLNILATAVSAKEIGIYLPLVYDTKMLQENLQSDPVLGKYEIRIFQKLDDFNATSESQKFDLAVLPSSYQRYYQDYKVLSQLTGSDPKMKNMIVSFKKELPASFSVAVIDEVGKKNIKSWLKQICSKCSKQKDVKKAKDLYPMLALGSTDSILVNAFNFEKIKVESGADLFVVFMGEDEDFPAIYAPAGKPAPNIAGIASKTFSSLNLAIGGASK